MPGGGSRCSMSSSLRRRERATPDGIGSQGAASGVSDGNARSTPFLFMAKKSKSITRDSELARCFIGDGVGLVAVSDQSMLRSDIFFSLALAGGAAAVRLSPRMAAAATAPIRITPQEHSVALVALGCPKNTVDAEVMLGDLQRHGLRVVREPENADIVVVNTCAFVEDAKRESVAAIVDAARLKADRSSRVRGLYVTGCMAQRYAEELADELPEVDAVVGFESCAASRCGTTTPRPPLRGVTPLEGGVARAPRYADIPSHVLATLSTSDADDTEPGLDSAAERASVLVGAATVAVPSRNVPDVSRTCPGPVQDLSRCRSGQRTTGSSSPRRTQPTCASPRAATTPAPFAPSRASAAPSAPSRSTRRWPRRDPPRSAEIRRDPQLSRAEEISRDEPSSAELSRGCRRGCSSSEACARST